MPPTQKINAIAGLAAISLCVVHATKEHFKTKKSNEEMRNEIRKETLTEQVAIAIAQDRIQMKIRQGEYDGKPDVFNQLRNDLTFETMIVREQM